MTTQTKLVINDALVARIRQHGAATYPHECCGALLGRDAEHGREVVELLPLENRRADSPHNRFSLRPEDFLAAEKAAEQKGLALVGWYHSHPDSPPLPSEYDREHAWPWFSYIIVSVEKGALAAVASWRLADDRSGFHFEEMEVISGALV